MKQEKTSYENMAMVLSDLQAAWQCLKESVIYGAPSSIRIPLLLKIEEATQWDYVYDLPKMQKTLQEFSYVVKDSPVDGEVKIWMKNICSLLNEALTYSRSPLKN